VAESNQVRYFRPDPIPADLREPLAQWVDQQLRRVEVASGTQTIVVNNHSTQIYYLEENDPIQDGRLDDLEENDSIQDGRLDDLEQLPPMRMLAPYVPDGSTVPWGTVVFDAGWLMHANKDTAERAAPQPTGPKETILPDDLAAAGFLEEQAAAVIYTGHLYTFVTSGWLGGLRVEISELGENTNYRFVVVRNPGGANPVASVIEEPVLNQGEWTVLTVVNEIVVAGEQVLVYIDAYNSAAEQTWAYNWNMQTPSNTVTPTSGAWNTNIQTSLLRINHLDAEAVPVDHQLELQLVPQSIVEISEVGDPSKYVHLKTQGAYTEGADWTEYDVIVIDEGVAGRPAVGAGCQIRARQPVLDTTKYMEHTLYWSGNPPPAWVTVEGFKQYNGVDVPGNSDSAYGVDIAFTPAYVSPDWDLMAPT
jgi:hypothetical protein